MSKETLKYAELDNPRLYHPDPSLHEHPYHRMLEFAEKHPTKMHNDKYGLPLEGYLECVFTYLLDFGPRIHWEQAIARRDIDTVCGLELYKMKRSLMQPSTLSYEQFYSNYKFEGGKATRRENI